MSDFLQLILFVVGWWVLQTWIFPRLGIQT
jgi:hypothetical protein